MIKANRTLPVRHEKDSLGHVDVPRSALYGAQTQRAVELYQISGLKHSPLFIDAYLYIKKGAARVNARLKMLEARKARAIIRSCDEMLAGKFREAFVVDVFQMGAGTSIHMNVNEVLANRANEILGGKRGVYDRVNPNDDVNMGQSTNDTFPSALRLSGLLHYEKFLRRSVLDLELSLARKGKAFDRILKSARTHLQDAVPIRLGQEFKAYAGAVRKARLEVERSLEGLKELGIGGSAAGTGLNTKRGYAGQVTREIGKLMGVSLRPAEDMREAMQSQRPVAQVSASLRNLAIEVGRIANDLRLLSSGPTTGLAEVYLPSTAPGSSIMPGKVNPSVLEMTNMVCFQVSGCDQVIAQAVAAGQLELNVMMPVMSFNLNFMIMILGNALKTLVTNCVDGIAANEERCRHYLETSMGLATALNPHIGYAKAAEVVKEAFASKKTIVKVIRERGILSDAQIKSVMNPHRMTEPER